MTAQYLPTNIASPLLDHAQRLDVARRVANYELGLADGDFAADGILAAYFMPTNVLEGELSSYDVCVYASHLAETAPDATPPADIESELPDHARRVEKARDFAYYQFGQESCADSVLGAYFAPSTAIADAVDAVDASA
jgi:hypothetical protein